MLHRSFKPAKCKTALKLAVSRIKLLKNKKDAQVKQIKRELAQMMESGQYRTARIRVEHVVREEKLRAAYELVEIYCELVAARMPMVESQKNCPIDMKEAVASVIFASPRCSDVPELVDIRKHFTTKYGKEFVSAAIELHPDSGVSRMLIEKLSVKSPDGPTKMKILEAIALEHNVKWEPEAYEEKPPEDLLNGTNNYGMAGLESIPPPPTHDVRVPSNTHVPPNNMANKAHAEPPPGPPPPDQPPNAQVPRRTYDYHDGRMNCSEPNARSTTHLDHPTSTTVSANEATTSAGSHHETTSSATRRDQTEMHAFSVDSNSSGRQNWNMEFKDAASAAQAAAESAERAGMAARAAAELSRQYSSEMRNKSNQSTSVPTSTRFNNNDYSVNNIQTSDQYPQKKSPEHQRHDSFDKVSMKRQSGNSVDMHESEKQAGSKPQNIPHFGGIRSEKISSRTSSRSSSSIGSDHREGDFKEDDDINNSADLGMGNNSIRSPSPSYSGHFRDNQDNSSSVYQEDFVNIHESTSGVASERNDSQVFDDSGSDDDNYKGQESNLFSSPARNSFPSASQGPWIFEQNTDKVPFKTVSPLRFSPPRQSLPVFSEGLRNSSGLSETNDLLPVTFDASDGPSSDSEGESVMPKPTIQSFNSGKSQRAHPEISQGIEHSIFSDKWSGDNDLPSSPPSPRPKKSSLDTNAKIHLPQAVKDSDGFSDTDNEVLPFGMLKGGLRNKGFRNSLGTAFPSKQVTQDTPPVRKKDVSQISSEEPYSQKGSTKLSKEKRTKTPVTYVSSSDDSSDDELSHETLSSSRQDLYGQKVISSVPDDSSEDELSHGTRSSSRKDLYHQTSVSQRKTNSKTAPFFKSDDSEAEEDLPRNISSTVSRPRLSRRTQPSTSNSVRSSGLRTTSSTSVSNSSRASDYANSSSRSSNVTETLDVPLRSQEQQRPTEQTTPYSVPEPKMMGSSMYGSSSSRSYNAGETLPSASSQTRSSERVASQEWRRPLEQAAIKPISESKRSSRIEGPKSFSRDESPSAPLIILKSERTEATDNSRPSGSASFGKEQSFDPPKIIRSESSESSKSSGYKSLTRDQSPNLPAKVVRSERTEPSKFSPPKAYARDQTSDPPPMAIRSARTAPSKFSPPKSYTKEQTSDPPPKAVRSEITGTLKSSSSLGKATHVHPKLPDSDDLFAKFAALKQNRQ